MFVPHWFSGFTIFRICGAGAINLGACVTSVLENTRDENMDARINS